MRNTLKSKNARKRVILLIFGILFFVYCLLTLLPWQPVAYGYDLDSSWGSAVHIAFRDKIQFGKDFIYSHGPYGFLGVAQYYFPETYGYGFGFCFLIALAAWAGLFKLFRYCWNLGDGSIFFLIPLFWFFPNHYISFDSFQFTLVILPLVLYFYVSKRLTPSLILTTINSALSSQIKHTYFLLAIACVALIAIDEIGKLKRIPRVAGIYLAFMVIFWLFAAQDFSNIPSYIVNSWEVIRGFSAAMGIPGELNEVLIYLFVTSTFLLLTTIVELQNPSRWRILPILGLAVIFFITFKEAFTRHDSHALQAVFNAIPIILIYTALLWSTIKNTWLKVKIFKFPPFLLLLGVTAISAIIMSSQIFNHYLQYGCGSYALKTLNHLALRIPQVVKVVMGKEDFPAIAEQGKAAIRNAKVLPPISGTVDLYPNEISSIFAYDLQYTPKPTVQSFLAYTDKLAKLNAKHLTQPDAAENIFFDLQPIDGRLPSFEDGLSWPELLTRYDITDLENSYLLLQRNSQPRQYQFKPSLEREIAFNEWFDIEKLPQPLWAKIEISPNIIGKITTAIFRLPPLNIDIETTDGVITGYRTVGDIMKEGFLLSPVLSNQWDFLDFATTDWQKKLANKQIKRFRIVAEGFNAKQYSLKYRVNLNQFQFSRQNFEGVKGWKDWFAGTMPIPLNGSLQKVNIDDSAKTGWLAHAPTKLAIALKGKKKVFSTNFGILNSAVQNSIKENLGDGVEFKIIALQANGKQKVLFTRDIHPRIKPQDRGTQNISLDISQMEISQLILETSTKNNNSYDSSYWSEIKLE